MTDNLQLRLDSQESSEPILCSAPGSTVHSWDRHAYCRNQRDPHTGSLTLEVKVISVVITVGKANWKLSKLSAYGENKQIKAVLHLWKDCQGQCHHQGCGF